MLLGLTGGTIPLTFSGSSGTVRIAVGVDGPGVTGVEAVIMRLRCKF